MTKFDLFSLCDHGFACLLIQTRTCDMFLPHESMFLITARGDTASTRQSHKHVNISMYSCMLHFTAASLHGSCEDRQRIVGGCDLKKQTQRVPSHVL